MDIVFLAIWLLILGVGTTKHIVDSRRRFKNVPTMITTALPILAYLVAAAVSIAVMALGHSFLIVVAAGVGAEAFVLLGGILISRPA